MAVEALKVELRRLQNIEEELDKYKNQCSKQQQDLEEFGRTKRLLEFSRKEAKEIHDRYVTLENQFERADGVRLQLMSERDKLKKEIKLKDFAIAKLRKNAKFQERALKGSRNKQQKQQDQLVHLQRSSKKNAQDHYKPLQIYKKKKIYQSGRKLFG